MENMLLPLLEESYFSDDDRALAFLRFFSVSDWEADITDIEACSLD